MGGLEAMKAHNEKKAKILYDYLDQSKLFKGTVVPSRTSSVIRSSRALLFLRTDLL